MTHGSTEWVNYRCSTGRYCGRGRTLFYPVYSFSMTLHFCFQWSSIISMINFEKKIPTLKIQSQIKSGRAIAYQNPASQEILSIFWYGFCFRFTFSLLVSPANWKIKLWSAKTDFYVLWPHFMENTESKGSFTYAFCYWMDFHLVWRCVNFLLEMTAFYPTLWNGQYISYPQAAKCGS